MKLFDDGVELRIREAIRSAGQTALHLSAQGFEVAEKGVNDYVTSVDRELDRQLATAFSTLFPSDGVITEENPASPTVFRSTYPRFWCIDPIDGTDDFIKGRKEYAVMVGLLQQSPIAGWIYAPAHDILYYGGRDWGLYQTIGTTAPEPMLIREPPSPAVNELRVILGDKDQANFGAAIAQQIPGVQFYSLGSFGLKVMDVILGRAGIYLYCNRRVKLWDTVGPVALAQAAGLVCCDLTGAPLSFAADAVNLETLAHQQSIVIGWAPYVEALLPRIRNAVASVGDVL